ncbi:MAG: hypothetical protein ACTIJ6_01060 [Leucobacter sp.]
MTPSDKATAVRDEYLAQLDIAIGELPHHLAIDLRSGIIEELSGLDKAQLTQRIAELGTPQQVATAARTAHLDEEPQPARTAQSREFPESRGFAFTAAIVLGVGGIVLPFIGWVIGATLVSISKLWTTREKAWAIIFTPAAVLFTPLVSFLIRLLTTQNGAASSASGQFSLPTTVEASPLIPATYDLIWSSVLLGGLIVAPLTAV